MKRFKTYLEEEKNVHMEHLEDSVLNFGVKGARDAINFLRSVRDMLAGNSNAPVSSTVKWDGSPAIFAGSDPRDGKFFVAKKGIFNKNPKIYKTPQEVDQDLSGDLATKFKLALEYLPLLNINGVIQGDFLYSNDTLKTDTIDGEKYITFHPNTIVYTVPFDSDLGRTIRASKIGIVWHTKYSGDSFDNMKAIFGKDISGTLNTTKNVWHTDATFKDVSGKATMTKKETDEITSILSQAGKLFRKIDAKVLNTIAEDEELKTRVKAHFNSKIREGQPITNPRAHVRDLVNYVTDYYNKLVDSKKTDRGKKPALEKKEKAMKFFANANMNSLVAIFELINSIIKAKEIVVRKMDQASSVGTFLKTSDGYKVTSPEGYVAIDRDGNAVKLINRLEFSKANFSKEFIKGWQR